MTVAPDGTVEFSRRLRLDRLAGGDVEMSLAANAEERAALAARFGLDGLAQLSGTLRVRRPAGGPIIRVEGELAARVTQTCVVTLEPVENEVAERFVQLFTVSHAPEDGEVFVDPESEDMPEPLTGDSLDLGEVLAEQLALALDPYPRAPQAEFPGASYGGDDAAGDAGEPEPADTPFAVLKQLKRER